MYKRLSSPRSTQQHLDMNTLWHSVTQLVFLPLSLLSGADDQPSLSEHHSIPLDFVAPKNGPLALGTPDRN